MLRLLTRFARRIVRCSDTAFGFALATFACAWTWGFAAHFGTGWEARLAGCSAGLLGLAAGLGLRSRLVAAQSEWMPRAWLAGVSVVGSFWIAFVAAGTSRFSIETLTSSSKTLLLLFGCGLLTVAPPAGLTGLSLARDPRRMSGTLLGCGLGLFCLPATLIAGLGMDVAVLFAATVYGMGVTLRWNEEGEDRAASPAPYTPTPLWAACLLATGGALLMAASGRWTFQLFLDAPCWVFARWGGLCCGLAGGIKLWRQWPAQATRAAGLTLGCLAALAIVAFPFFIETSLSISATVSPLWLTLALRGLLAALFPFAAGLAIATGLLAGVRTLHPAKSPARGIPSALGQTPDRGAATLTMETLAPRGLEVAGFDLEFVPPTPAAVPPATTRSRLPALAAGLAFLCGLLLQPQAQIVLACCALAGCVVALVQTWRRPAHSNHEFPAAAFLRRGLNWGPVAAVGLLGVWSLADTGRYSPSIAARILFNPSFIGGWLNGQSLEHLRHADSTRLLTTLEGRDGTWTVWKQRDAYVQLRENGLPRGMVSLDTNVAPQSAPDVVTTVLPLVLHRDPQSVLFLGMNSPASLATSLEFPVYSIRCIEPDPAIPEIIDTHLQPHTQTALFRDDRVEWLAADPVLAARATHDKTYDVIVAHDGQSMPWSTSPRWTRDHFQSVSHLLSDSGIFCQRFLYGDVTARPVREAAATLRTAFAHVTVVEPLPGELLFLCSNAEPVTLGEHLMGRLDKRHVRYTLGRMGWDWSVVMGLSYIPAEALDAFAESATVNSVSNARFVATLTQEVYRWGAKWNTVRESFARHSTTAVRQLGKESPELFDVSKRFEDIQLASKIVGAHPDEFWEYRKSLRDRLKDRPRTAIVQVKHEGLKYGLHEEDERRKEYLVALGKAVSAEPPTIELVSAMAEFAEPFDPLLSPFVHEEAARLYGKCAEAVAHAEFDHWRHAIYFGTGQDRSVRNVVSALQVLREHPECVPDPLDRWDALQSLLEVMRERWITRAQLSRAGRSKFEAIDLSQSIAAAEAALLDLDMLAKEVGAPAEGWCVRKKVIERDLIRDLESYRAEQIARIEAERRAKTAGLPVNTLPTGLPAL